MTKIDLEAIKARCGAVMPGSTNKADVYLASEIERAYLKLTAVCDRKTVDGAMEDIKAMIKEQDYYMLPGFLEEIYGDALYGVKITREYMVKIWPLYTKTYAAFRSAFSIARRTLMRDLGDPLAKAIECIRKLGAKNE